VRFLIDAQLPPALARLLSDHGHVAEHVCDIGLGDTSDRALCGYALEHDAVLVTKDEDFAAMVLLGGSSPAVVWVRVGNTRRRALLEWFEPLIGRIVGLVAAGNRLIELR
jgi:predicted nuclease of predicted toxin-antitoxin system